MWYEEKYVRNVTKMKKQGVETETMMLLRVRQLHSQWLLLRMLRQYKYRHKLRFKFKHRSQLLLQ